MVQLLAEQETVESLDHVCFKPNLRSDHLDHFIVQAVTSSLQPAWAISERLMPFRMATILRPNEVACISNSSNHTGARKRYPVVVQLERVLS